MLKLSATVMLYKSIMATTTLWLCKLSATEQDVLVKSMPLMLQVFVEV